MTIKTIKKAIEARIAQLYEKYEECYHDIISCKVKGDSTGEDEVIEKRSEDMEVIIPKESYKEAKELVRQLKGNPICTYCFVVAGYRAKTKQLYEELYGERIERGLQMFNKNDYPWIVAWTLQK